jgi:hypothetical protein
MFFSTFLNLLMQTLLPLLVQIMVSMLVGDTGGTGA